MLDVFMLRICAALRIETSSPLGISNIQACRIEVWPFVASRTGIQRTDMSCVCSQHIAVLLTIGYTIREVLERIPTRRLLQFRLASNRPLWLRETSFELRRILRPSVFFPPS